MSKTKSSDLPHYELLYLISNKYSEVEVKPIIEKINALIQSNQGKITQSVELGKKRLAYAIKGFRFGYYNLVEFDMPGINLAKVDHTLRMMSEILRQQIVAKQVKTEEQINRDKQIAEKIAAKNLAAVKAAKQEVSARAAEAGVVGAKAVDKDKVDLKDLDEKLDKILETDNLL
ncbi:MAG: 30S ribosomal protein S6 [Patescibacteria group bacterium]|nr:30S ribosomal protein S6 [Patescibacteria group bacterium]